ncbi:MAG: formate dehydrogenase accessory sulfurtransferase FdhD [Candidatus Bathyarchaeia archaeon]|nr:formate dehydrogenase accessory sulfurtransferase FdhD [Candidatus Bathyarchaeota archaeon]
MLIEHGVLRFDQSKGNFESLRDVIAIEEVTRLYINDGLYAVFHHLPSQVKELIVGYLLTEGLIERIEDILEMKFSGMDAHVRLSEDKYLGVSDRIRLITVLCSGKIAPLNISKSAQKLRFNDIKFSANVIFKSIEILNSRASIFRASGGTHSAALINGDCEIMAFAEDIGRHNAIDKVVGEATIKGANLSELILASTGRLTSEVVIKVVRVGIPVLVSPSAPTSMGLKIAESSNLTLIGFVRKKRFNIYTSPHRINEWVQLNKTL